MAPPRSFDYDRLNELMREQPELTTQQLADAMTYYERYQCTQGIHWHQGEQCGSATYPRIEGNSISGAVAQKRRVWDEEGRPVRGRPYHRLIPWLGIPNDAPGYWLMDMRLRHLKTLRAAELGSRTDPVKLRQAQDWAARMRQDKRVVDVTDEGQPFDRAANPDELDEDGELIRLWALPRPGWEQASL